MAQETELKLVLQPQDVPQLLAHPLLAGTPPQRLRLRNTYFDTADRALMQQRIAVRERRVGRRTLLTVKTAGTSVGGLSRRGEWEGPTRPGALDFAALVDDAALAQQLSALRPRLLPLFHTDFARRRWRLSHAGADIELALDEGTIRTDGPSGQTPRQAALLELELELLSGPVAALWSLAQALCGGDTQREGLWLFPSDRSKAERGLALYRGEAPQPQRAQPPALRPGMHPVTAFRTAAQEALAQWQANVQGLLSPRDAQALPDPEFIHQARVALRRLRTALRLFREHLPADFVSRWSGFWQNTARALSDARDGDVIDERLLGWLTARARRGLPPDDLAPLADWVLAQRRAAHHSAARHLLAPALAQQLLAFAEAVQALPAPADAARGHGLADWAGDTLARRLRGLLRQARHAHRLDLDGLHALRIRCKKLRYAQQTLQPLLQGRHPARLEERLAVLVRTQERLGELNDLATAQARLQACALPEAAVWRRQLQRQQARILQTLPQLQRELRQLARH